MQSALSAPGLPKTSTAPMAICGIPTCSMARTRHGAKPPAHFLVLAERLSIPAPNFVTNLAATVADRLCGTHEHVCVALIRRLAAGQPVSVARLAADMAIEEPAVSAVLQQMSDVAY